VNRLEINVLGDIMSMCVEESIGEWYESVPGTGGIYRLIANAGGGTGQPDRIGAVIALGDSGDPRAVRPLIHCCNDEDSEIRRHATDALCKLRSGRAVYALIERMKDKSEQAVTRQHAASALAAIRTYSAIEGLRDRIFDGNEDPAIRSYVAVMLGRMRIL
jgi:HEAT repeat protein